MDGPEHVAVAVPPRRSSGARPVVFREMARTLAGFVVLSGVTVATILASVYFGSQYHFGEAGFIQIASTRPHWDATRVALVVAACLASTFSFLPRPLRTWDHLVLLVFQLGSLIYLLLSAHPHALNDMSMGVVAAFAFLSSFRLVRDADPSYAGWTGLLFWGLVLLSLFMPRLHIPAVLNLLPFVLHAGTTVVEFNAIVLKSNR
jgi:hypothetical protein